MSGSLRLHSLIKHSAVQNQVTTYSSNLVPLLRPRSILIGNNIIMWDYRLCNPLSRTYTVWESVLHDIISAFWLTLAAPSCWIYTPAMLRFQSERLFQLCSTFKMFQFERKISSYPEASQIYSTNIQRQEEIQTVGTLQKKTGVPG